MVAGEVNLLWLSPGSRWLAFDDGSGRRTRSRNQVSQMPCRRNSSGGEGLTDPASNPVFQEPPFPRFEPIMGLWTTAALRLRRRTLEKAAGEPPSGRRGRLLGADPRGGSTISVSSAQGARIQNCSQVNTRLVCFPTYLLATDLCDLSNISRLDPEFRLICCRLIYDALVPQNIAFQTAIQTPRIQAPNAFAIPVHEANMSFPSPQSLTSPLSFPPLHPNRFYPLSQLLRHLPYPWVTPSPSPQDHQPDSHQIDGHMPQNRWHKPQYPVP